MRAQNENSYNIVLKEIINKRLLLIIFLHNIYLTASSNSPAKTHNKPNKTRLITLLLSICTTATELIRQRVLFKTAVLVWRCLNSAAPIYLVDLCIEAASVPGRRRLRSASTVVLQVPWSRTSTGQRRFAIFGP